MPAPVGLAARAAWAMTRVPSAEVSRMSRVSVAPPAMGGMGGRESASTHMSAPFGSRGPRAVRVISGGLHASEVGPRMGVSEFLRAAARG
jgi:hypothetical protein